MDTSSFAPQARATATDEPTLSPISRLISLYTYTFSPSMRSSRSPSCKPSALSSGQPSAKPATTGT